MIEHYDNFSNKWNRIITKAYHPRESYEHLEKSPAEKVRWVKELPSENIRITKKIITETSRLEGKPLEENQRAMKRKSISWEEVFGLGHKRFRCQSRTDQKSILLRKYNLTTTIENIYTKTKEELNYWPSQKKRSGFEKRSKGVYCNFHLMNRHDTNQCKVFRKMVLHFLQQGKLKQFVRD